MCAWAAGSYTKGNSGTGGWTGDASLGIGIEAGRHDTQDNDFATGINQCINKDGSNSFTGNANLGGFRPTNLAAGTAAAPALCVGNDVNTGVFGPAADTWAVATNGSERLRVDSTGNVGIGVTNPSLKLDVQLSTNTADGLRVLNSNAGSAAASVVYLGNDQSTTASRIVVNSNANTGSYAGGSSFNFYQGLNAPMSFWTAATERIRISTSGIATFGTTNTDPAGANVAGVAIYGGSDIGYTSISRASGLPVKVNRTTNDGNLIELAQDGVTEGAISVSGNTITYGAFSGSHWSQLSDNSKPEILRGTVLETIDELCEWENEENERLAKVKVSDTVASKAVYGVFMDWDNDWTATNDMKVTSLGAFVCRLHADAMPEVGDLLESNGDGTARVQADDIVKSSTIGKVTCSARTHEYDDGTFCVPVVLMCG
jgi:hypothetical protein